MPEGNGTMNVPVKVKVDRLCYDVDGANTTWLSRLLAFQMPWEWKNGAPETKNILNHVSFEVNSGQMLAILGESGSGKTSLMDVLACRTTEGQIKGHVTFNGQPLSLDLFRSCSAYVRQDERLLPHLTVEETLTFVAQLKLSSFCDKLQLRDRVDNVIAELGLSHVTTSLVGGETVRGISGGERRRVSIAVQLLQDPSVVLLDEPTSGLDAFTAHHLVETLRNLSDSGRTVIMSIHQPRSDIFELFGQVMLLSTGCVVYHGQAKHMIGYFTDLGYPCPELTNPCDYYVDLVTVDMQSLESELDSFQRIQTLVDTYNDRKTSFFNTPQPSDVTSDLTEPQIAIFSAQTSYWTQFSVLTRRAFKNNILDYGLLGIQAVQALIMSLMVGLVYYDLQLEQKDIRDHFSMMYIVSALYPYLVILDVIGKYHVERKTLFYEMMDGLYSFGPYFFAKILGEVPEHTFFVVLYCLPLYFLSGLQVNVTVIFKFMATAFTVVYCSRALSLWASATMPTFQVSVVLAQMIYTFCLLTCGYIINLDSLFIGLKWFENVSFLKWCYQAMCEIHIKGLEFSCNDTSSGPCITDGQEAFDIYSIGDDPLYIPLLVMAGEVVFLMLLFFVCGRLVKQRPYEA